METTLEAADEREVIRGAQIMEQLRQRHSLVRHSDGGEADLSGQAFASTEQQLFLEEKNAAIQLALDRHNSLLPTSRWHVERTESEQRAQVEMFMDFSRDHRSRQSIVDMPPEPVQHDFPSLTAHDTLPLPAVPEEAASSMAGTSTVLYGTTEEAKPLLSPHGVDNQLRIETGFSVNDHPPHDVYDDDHSTCLNHTFSTWSTSILHQIPAIAVVSLLLLMATIPIGVAYFPVGWSPSMDVPANATGTTVGGDSVHGPFPLPGKEALGIRMCLFSTLIGQLVLTFASTFENPIAFQLLENVPFYHAMAQIVIAEQGYGIDALATLFFLFGLSSIVVGAVFFTLGKLELGRFIYFFPSHVLLGCIGGIGLFIIITAIEVTNNVHFSLTLEGLLGLWDKIHLFGLVVALEALLRMLMALSRDAKGHARFPLLAPLFYCSIVPAFYVILASLGINVKSAKDAGYFFPDPQAANCRDSDNCTSLPFTQQVFDGHVFDMFRVLDLSLVSWNCVVQAFPTIVACACFSMIHVPINIPAFAVTADVDVDMNAELKAHGYSNVLSGLFGGLQNVMTYSFSVLYLKSGGAGKLSSLTIVAITSILFVFGPTLAKFIPRCMAGTLLLHIGIDLTLEGIYDSYGKYDHLEYTGILVIAIVMTLFGMSAALIAGIIAALSTYAMQSIQNVDPVFKIMSAYTLRSSAWTRPAEALKILDNKETGRSRIMLVQLQGHLFFGNVAQLSDSIRSTLIKKIGTNEYPYIVILDFTMVVGMDSSAAHSIAKLKRIMHRQLDVEVTIFVTGRYRESFPCHYCLAEALDASNQETVDWNDISAKSKKAAIARRGSISLTPGTKSMQAARQLRRFPINRVCDCLDEALLVAEDLLIARENDSLLTRNAQALYGPPEHGALHILSSEEEKGLAERFLTNLAPTDPSNLANNMSAIITIVNLCHREEYFEGQIIWTQGAPSDCAKILISGTLVAFLEGTDISEIIQHGSVIGELGLVQGIFRLSTVRCMSPRAVLFSLGKNDWDALVNHQPHAARLVDLIVIRYLSQRVQHVSNRIFETRCLPI